MEKVTFAGAYGIRSQGDDAALLFLFEGLRKCFPDLTGSVVDRHADENHYASYGLSSLPNIEYATKAESVDRWFRGFNFSDDRTDLCQLQKAVEQSDLLILGAGNALVDYAIDLLRGPIPYFVILTLMAKMSGTPVMWYGLSVGPLRTDYGRKLSRLAAQLADVISVRDERSLGELKSLGWNGQPVLLPDPVIGLEVAKTASVHPVKVNALQRGGPLIAVSLRALPDSPELTFNDYLSRVAAVCDRLVAKHQVSLLFVPQCTYTHGSPMEDDRQVASALVERMSERSAAFVVNDHLSVQETVNLYAGATAAICTRLHANVSAALVGVPTLALNYNPKVASFMSWLGGEDQIVEFGEFSVERILCKVETIFSKREQIVARQDRRMAQGRRDVEKYIGLARGLISLVK